MVSVAALILLVEDDPDTLNLLEAVLSEEHPEYRLQRARTGREAVRKFAIETPDLVILDVGLPDIDGFTLAQQFRASSDVSILFVTARGSQADKVRGLRLGGDDYVVKPFSNRELVARTNALLRRTAQPGRLRPRRSLLHIAGLRLDPEQQRAWKDDEEIDLTPTEFRLLYLLTSHADQVLPHDKLLRRVWGEEYEGERQYVKAYIRRLRRKIEDDPANPELIRTIWGVGYTFSRPGEDELSKCA